MITRTLATLALAMSIALVTGCNDESAPVASNNAARAAHSDHDGHSHGDHATHDAPAKGSMGTITGGVPADITLVNTICPVSGESFNRDDKTLSAFEHDGKHYGVCCSDCIALFKKNPDKYLAKLQAAEAAAKDATGTTGDAAPDAATDAAKDATKTVTQ